MGGAAQCLLEVAQHPGDAGVIAEAMEVLDQQKGRSAAVQVSQPLQNSHRLTTPQPLNVQNALKAVDEIPAAQLMLQTGCCLRQQRFHPRFLVAADPDQSCPRSDQADPTDHTSCCQRSWLLQTPQRSPAGIDRLS
jgi:hypothetical protein